MNALEIYSLFLLIVVVLLGCVVAKVAGDRGVPGDPLLWGIAGALVFIIALPLALLMAPDPKLAEEKNLARGDSKKCPQCAELVRKEALKCRFCGYDFIRPVAPREDTKQCPKCYESVMRQAVRCRHCGYEFEPRRVVRKL